MIDRVQAIAIAIDTNAPVASVIAASVKILFFVMIDLI